MMEQVKEHFCWLKAAPPIAVEDQDTPRAGEEDADKSEAAPIDDHLLARLKLTCPEVSWEEVVFSKWPPSPPIKSSLGPIDRKTRSVLGVQRMTTVHLEHPALPFEFGMEMMPIFGSRNEALQWIESNDGMKFCQGAKALSLICFTTVGDI